MQIRFRKERRVHRIEYNLIDCNEGVWYKTVEDEGGLNITYVHADTHYSVYIGANGFAYKIISIHGRTINK